MAKALVPLGRPASDHLHPFVYWAIAALALWYVLSAWLLFGGGNSMELLLIMVSALMLIAVAIPAIIWLSWRRFRGGPQQREPRLRKWLSGEFVTWQGRLNAREAAVQVLLPLAAVAFGLTAIGIVLAITAATFAPA